MRTIPRGQRWKKSRKVRPAGRVAPLAAAAALAVAALSAGCSSSIQTPLPSLAPSSSSAMSQHEQAQAVDELNRLRATHEQDAARSIEESR